MDEVIEGAHKFPWIVQICVGPGGELVALDKHGGIWCSIDECDHGKGGIVRIQGAGYKVTLAPVTVKFKRWGK